MYSNNLKPFSEADKTNNKQLLQTTNIYISWQFIKI